MVKYGKLRGNIFRGRTGLWSKKVCKETLFFNTLKFHFWPVNNVDFQDWWLISRILIINKTNTNLIQVTISLLSNITSTTISVKHFIEANNPVSLAHSKQIWFFTNSLLLFKIIHIFIGIGTNWQNFFCLAKSIRPAL